MKKVKWKEKYIIDEEEEIDVKEYEQHQFDLIDLSTKQKEDEEF